MTLALGFMLIVVLYIAMQCIEHAKTRWVVMYINLVVIIIWIISLLVMQLTHMPLFKP